jgi:hypothetical protein
VGLETKTVTLGEVAAAMQANGLAKHKGWQKDNAKGEIVGACAIAQAAIRLEVDYSSLSQKLADIEVFNGGYELTKLSSYIMHLNDSTDTKVSKIGDEVARRIEAIRLMPLTVSRKVYKVAPTT